MLYKQYFIDDLEALARPYRLAVLFRRYGTGLLPTTLLVLVISIGFAADPLGQNIDEESNWYRSIGRSYDGYSRFDFTRYTKHDVDVARTKFLQIESDKSRDEWEGLYTREAMLGRAELIWSHRGGFVYAYVYHTLASIDHGHVIIDAGGSIRLVSGRSPGNKFIGGDHVKVRFGERHLLVPQNMLKDFAMFAVGLDVPDRRSDRVLFTEEGGVWEKSDDESKKLGDLPAFPASYAHLVRRPIESRVLSIGQLRIKREYSSTQDSDPYVQHQRNLTLSAGSRRGVRVGMTFWIDDLEERVEVISVGRNRSVAVLVRPVIDGEFCRNDEISEGQRFPCREPKIGMRARTKTKYF